MIKWLLTTFCVLAPSIAQAQSLPNPNLGAGTAINGTPILVHVATYAALLTNAGSVSPVVRDGYLSAGDGGRAVLAFLELGETARENDHRSALALHDLAAALGRLLVGHPGAGRVARIGGRTPQQQHIDPPVRRPVGAQRQA